MDQSWFEMRELRKRSLDEAVWIPLRASDMEKTGKFWHLGFKHDYFGLWSLAVPVGHKDRAEKLGWTDGGLAHSHQGFVETERYVPGDRFDGYGLELGGLALVLAQDGNKVEKPQWHLHQDFAITLGLRREGDVWVAINEGYIEVARFHHEANGAPTLLEVRAEHLKDYLCARGMALYVSWYRDRWEVVSNVSHITWRDSPFKEESPGNRWEGRLTEINEGGGAFGTKVAVMQIGREGVDYQEDVPSVGPLDANIVSKSWTIERDGPKLIVVRGERWRNEWVEPAEQSPRIRGDELPPSVYFITDAKGTSASRETLQDSGRWLWFKPDVIMALAQRRGGALEWYTRHTGVVHCTPNQIHFGMNRLGLVNAFAKDIAFLPDWQQRIWAGFNVTPDGGVSEELLASQAAGTPADTQAPEPLLAEGMNYLNQITSDKLGTRLFQDHEQSSALLARVHRFRAVDVNGLFALAKDIARLTIDSIDVSLLQKVVPPPKGAKWGSLTSLEHLLAEYCDKRRAHEVVGPLHGAYNLRHADAHLPASDHSAAYELVGIDPSAPFVLQGFQLLYSCVTALYEIAEILVRGLQ